MKVPDPEIQALNLQRRGVCPNWSYTVRPRAMVTSAPLSLRRHLCIHQAVSVGPQTMTIKVISSDWGASPTKASTCAIRPFCMSRAERPWLAMATSRSLSSSKNASCAFCGSASAASSVADEASETA